MPTATCCRSQNKTAQFDKALYIDAPLILSSGLVALVITGGVDEGGSEFAAIGAAFWSAMNVTLVCPSRSRLICRWAVLSLYQ
jgi:hypothetical protein